MIFNIMNYLKKLFKNITLFILLFSPIINAAATEKAIIIFAGEMTEIATEKKGGYPELASLLAQQRQSKTPSFFLFSGGSLGPSTFSSLDRGTHIIDLLNSLEPDAMGVAKREFSFLEDELSMRAYEAGFPLVSSNIEDSFTNENLDGLVESVIVQNKQYKLGILSILDESVIEQYGVSRIKILRPFLTVKKLAKKLRKKGADLIILLYSTPSTVITKLLDENIVDLSLIRGETLQTQAASEKPHHSHDILLRESGKAVILNLEWENGNSRSLKIKRETINLSDYPKDTELLKQVIRYTERLASLLQQNIGLLTTEMDTNLIATRTQQNPFGNYIADTLKDYTNADIALINGGTIRGEKNYKANTILLRSDIVKELPFRNKIALLSVSGIQVIAALEIGFSLIKEVKGRFPQISGMQVEYDSSKSVGNRVISVKINGKAINLNQKYKLVTTDYLASGGDGFTVFKNLHKLTFKNQMSRLVFDVIIDNIKSTGKLAVKSDSRLIDLNSNLDGSNYE
jgi:5'-nucleotidase/UDP-sugar diphosphatase